MANMANARSLAYADRRGAFCEHLQVGNEPEVLGNGRQPQTSAAASAMPASSASVELNAMVSGWSIRAGLRGPPVRTPFRASRASWSSTPRSPRRLTRGARLHRLATGSGALPAAAGKGTW
eukprot:5122649-Alexandrium_andersonii.AAC.1